MSTEKRRHHVLTEAYLAQWRDPSRSGDPRVWVFEKSTLEGKLRHPNRILVERHYFTEVEPGGERHAPVEERLAREVESRVKRVLQTIEQGSRLSAADRAVLWKFVVTMFVRTAWWRKPLVQIVERAVQEAPSRAVNQVLNGLVLGRAARRKVARYRRRLVAKASKIPELKVYADALRTKVHPMLVSAALDFEEAQEYPFTLFMVEGPLSLITSDTPCAPEDRSVIALPSHSGYVITCPLTSRVAFVGGLHLAEEYKTVDADWARKFNARVRSNAERWLVAASGEMNESWFLSEPGWPVAFREVALRALKEAVVGSP